MEIVEAKLLHSLRLKPASHDFDRMRMSSTITVPLFGTEPHCPCKLNSGSNIFKKIAKSQGDPIEYDYEIQYYLS